MQLEEILNRTFQLKFQFVLEPIILYGSEIWGPKLNHEFDKWDKKIIESFHT